MTKTKKRIVEAYERGYRVHPAGRLLGPKGELKIKVGPSQKYPTFSTNWGGRVFGIPVHQFAAYCYFGDTYLTGKQIVRHLDGNRLNIARDNIVLGSYSDNERDKPVAVRVKNAQTARASQKFTPPNAKLLPEQVLEIRKIYETAAGKKLSPGAAAAMCVKYGVSRTVLIKVKKGEYYPNVR
jgi:hypothetical protein